jgi:hypothetical protein
LQWRPLTGKRWSNQGGTALGRLAQIGLLLLAVALLVAVVDFVTNPSGSPVRSALKAAIDETTRQYQQLTGQPAPPDAAAKPSPAPPTTAPRRAGRSTAASPPTPETPPAPSPAITRAADPPPSPEVPSTAPSGLRQFFLPGRAASWTRYDIAVTAPVAIRSAGRISVGDTASGPNGVPSIQGQRVRNDDRAASAATERPLGSAPYLALIGRVCSGSACSEPFLVGSDYIVCPSDVKMSGHLQLWTNNNVRVAGQQTAAAFSSAVGGYSFSVEPAQSNRCGADARQTPSVTAAMDAKALASGRTLESTQFVVPSSQSSWKPFFLPLNVPLVVRASGTMRPRNGADPTGPEGIAVPRTASWSYPGASDLVVDEAHRLFDPSMPYQALIGRLCRQGSCGPAFVVGRERLLCPDGSRDAWLELWINHIIPPTGLLGSRMTLTLDAFELQTRIGEYRFTVSEAESARCAAR